MSFTPIGNQGYYWPKQQAAQGSFSWPTLAVKFVLLDGTYTFDATHQNLVSVGSASRITTSGTLTAQSVTSQGYCLAASFTQSGVAGTAVINQAVLCTAGTSDAVSNLISYWDTGVGFGQFAPQNGNITYSFGNQGVITF